MKKRPLAMFVLFVVCFTLTYAQDRNLKKVQESIYCVSFCARDATVPIPIGHGAMRGSLSPGHAFIVWSVDDVERGLCAAQAFGFDPKRGGIVPLISFKYPIAGMIFDEYLRNPGQGYCVLTVKVSKADYEATQRIREQWDGKEYSITNQDCVTFVDTIARRIGLDTPDRPSLFKGVLDNFPQVYMSKLKVLNEIKGVQGQRATAPRLSITDPKQQDEATKIQETLSDLLGMYTDVSAQLAKEHKSINAENTYLEQERGRLSNTKDKKSKDDPVRTAQKSLRKAEDAIEVWKRPQVK